MIIQVNLQSNLSIVSEEIFKELLCIILGKATPPAWGPHLFMEQVCLSNFW